MSDGSHHRRGLIHRAVLIAAASIAAACSSGGGATPATTSDPATTGPSSTGPASTGPPTTAGPGGELVVDPTTRTALALPTVAAFEQLATTGVGGQEVVKFSITDFLGDPTVEWLDSTFYTLHDEWYWFQLLNGHPVAGFDVEPVEGLSFADVPAVYEWALDNRARLPLDLRFTSLERLYSPAFYDAALDDAATRSIALGAVIRLPAGADTPERWLLELEYRDGASAFQIERYFNLLVDTLPDDIAAELLWVPRSREQEIVADEMASSELPYGDRTIRFDDLVVAGDTEVYAEGVAAGRLLLVTDDGRYALSDAGPNDVVVVQRTPDVLPPGNALVTGTPQTPLAHVNVLALNRGIPNAFLGGLVDNLELSQLGRVRAPVAVRAVAPDQLDIRALTDDEFAAWNALRGATEIAVPSVDLAAMQYVEDLVVLAAESPTESDIAALRPVVGGKAAGFLGLAAPGTVTMPDRPIAITVRSYFEHIDRLGPTIDAMLASREFTSSARSRFILLEGREDYESTYTTDRDRTFADEFARNHPQGTPLGDILAAGGLKEMIRDLPIEPATLAAIEFDLAANFAGFSETQGLRFRSSSSVEDIEGFNGAGLYSSTTGFLDPTVLPDEADHKRTVERAIKRTWSSYWNVEAVEERRYENVDHRSGAMAILVHARFDDPLEVSNGVATFTLLPPTEGGGSVMRLNVQAGATSVTNPDNEPGQAPEIVELRQAGGNGAPTIERIGASSLVDDGGVVLDDDQLLDVWAQLRDVTLTWQARVNAELPIERRITTLTLDFEFRAMAPAWPAIDPAVSDDDIDDSGTVVDAPRIVIKQARTLEPGLRAIPAVLTNLPIPGDVLARTTRAERIVCPAAGPNAGEPDDVFVELFTDPLAAVDMGYATEPLRVVESGSPNRLADETCTDLELFVSASDYLQELFAARVSED